MFKDRLYEMLTDISTNKWGTEKTLVGMLAGIVGAGIGLGLAIIAYPNEPKEVIEIVIDNENEEEN